VSAGSDVLGWQPALVAPGFLRADYNIAAPVARGIVLDRDDQIRRHVITRLMCDGELRYADVDQRFDIRFEEYFAAELQRLAGDELAPLAVRPSGERRIDLTPLGRNLARNVCMVFDRYLDPTARASPTI